MVKSGPAAKKASQIRQSRSDRLFDAVNTAIMALTVLVMLYPLYFIVIASISEPYQVASGNVAVIPKGFTLEAYQNVFRSSSIWKGYRNTIFYTVLGTCYNLATLIPAAYVLSKKELPLRKGLSWFFFITMYFSGGMVPTFLLMKQLKLLNTPWILILGGVSCYNLIVSRTFFSSTIPDSLYEAAYIDGSSEFRAFFQIALPLAAPIVAVMALYSAVGHWNSYYSALLYIQNKELYPLQMVLRDILIQNEALLQMLTDSGDQEALADMSRRAYMAESMKYAVIFIASAPLLCVFPLIQKHFVKGVMIGSVKG